MHIRLSPAAVGWAGAAVVRLLARTVRVFEEWEDPQYATSNPDRPRAIYAFWHGGILCAALTHVGSGICIPISRHRDGEYVARMAERIGARPIRGSTRRGGARALLEMVRVLDEADVAITPDGPRGPRQVVQPGILQLARLSQRPIIAGAFDVAGAWVAPSWDRFVVPRPFARLAFCCGAPISVPRDASDREIEDLRRRLQADLLRLTARAREIAHGHAAPRVSVRNRRPGWRGRSRGQ
jgi:lysophospholipid acyltransferase (LPLAT)-like uncharacterized protein